MHLGTMQNQTRMVEGGGGYIKETDQIKRWEGGGKEKRKWKKYPNNEAVINIKSLRSDSEGWATANELRTNEFTASERLVISREKTEKSWQDRLLPPPRQMIQGILGTRTMRL